LTVDSTEHPFVDSSHQLPDHGTDPHRRKVMWVILSIVLVLIVVVAVVVLWRLCHYL